MFEQRRNEINTRLAEIRAQLTNTETALTDEQITALDTEARNLTAELTGLERRETVTRGMNGGQPASPEGGDGGHPGPVNPITGRGGMTPPRPATVVRVRWTAEPPASLPCRGSPPRPPRSGPSVSPVRAP